MKNRVLITGALSPRWIEEFRKNPIFEVHYHPDCLRQEVLERVSSADILVTRSETNVDSEVLAAGAKLKILARAAVGVGNIDLEEATKRGILVINCPGKNTNAAAEMTLTLMMAMLRNLCDAQAKVKSGGWDRHTFTGSEARGKTIGLVGLGNVGHRVAKFALGLDMKVLAYDPYISPEVFRRNGVEAIDSLSQLIQASDILSLHVPLNKETKGMITLEHLQSMRPGGYFINAARGGLVSESDLLTVLKSGHLAGAGIDTFESEPHPFKELTQHPKVYCSPHIGASTHEAQEAIGETVYSEVCRAVRGEVVNHPVNLPGVAIPDRKITRSYAVLAEKLGSMLAQMIGFNPTGIEVLYRGDLADHDHSLIPLSFMKGYCAQVSDEMVSYVNARSVFKSLGISLTEKTDPDFFSYRSAVKFIATGEGEHRFVLGGLVFDETHLRVSLVNEFAFELEPKAPCF